MNFRDFTRFLAKSGCRCQPPPKLCTGLVPTSPPASRRNRIPIWESVSFALMRRSKILLTYLRSAVITQKKTPSPPQRNLHCGANDVNTSNTTKRTEHHPSIPKYKHPTIQKPKETTGLVGISCQCAKQLQIRSFFGNSVDPAAFHCGKSSRAGKSVVSEN